MAIDFEKQVAQIADMIEPDVELAPETKSIAIESLEEINRDFGPESDNALAYHNAPHTIGDMRRNIRILNVFFLPYMKPEHRRRAYDLGMVGGGVHDLEQFKGPGKNEQASVDRGIAKIEAADGPLNTQIFKKRLTYFGLATMFELRDGRLVHVNLHRGSRDPIKLVAAYGDVGGIGMEGDSRMWEDGTNLYTEMTDRAGEEWTLKGLYKFLADEAPFLRHQSNPEQVKADIARYFPDDTSVIYDELHTLFHGNVRSAFDLAVRLGEQPELEGSIGRLVDAVDRPLLGPLIGKMIRRKAARD